MDKVIYVIARRVLALPDEAILCDEEAASTKTKIVSQRHHIKRRFFPWDTESRFE
jgi:hypothetical protein